jgi:CO/xanthine dehydrogenase Mo-binding subunit
MTSSRVPAEAATTFALETLTDDAALACGEDPVEFRITNAVVLNPQSGAGCSSKVVSACLRAGAARFGWQPRGDGSRPPRHRGAFVGSGLAAATSPATFARGRHDRTEHRLVSMYDFGAVFTEVRVHVTSGEVAVTRVLGVFSASCSPMTTQLRRGVAQGVQWALGRQSAFDDRVVDICFVDDESFVRPMGPIREIAVVGTAASIANAFRHATGTRVHALPITVAGRASVRAR